MKGIDIFCGAGGMSLGAQMAGIDITLAIDFNQSAIETFKYNHPETSNVLCESITKVNFSKYNDDYFILMGGPPCQGFSVSNTKTRNNEITERNNFRLNDRTCLSLLGFETISIS